MQVKSALRPAVNIARRAASLSRRAAAIEAHRKAHKGFCVSIGSGDDVREGWFNTDFTPRRPGVHFLDATQPFPFPDASVDRFYSEHMIEHVPAPQGLAMVGSCFKALKPGGRIRIVTPDAVQIARLVTDKEAPDVKAYAEALVSAAHMDLPPMRTAGLAFNIACHDWGHVFLYDFETMAAVMRHVGFEDVTRADIAHSADPLFHGLERHQHNVGDLINAYESMAVEATKPC
jgi:predicted SAM-dependent methyltransferase